MNIFKPNDRVEVRHSHRELGFTRFTNIEPVVTWHKGTVEAVQGDEIQVELDDSFRGWKTLFCNQEFAKKI